MNQNLPTSLRTTLLVVFATALLGQGRYTISTLTGSGSTLDGYTGDGGPATRARLNNPAGLALGRNGDLYIADTWNHVVRLVDASGRIRTIAGSGVPGFDGDGGPAIQAKLNFPGGIAIDSRGNIYIADTFNNRIRRVTPDGLITTFAGTGERGFSGDGGPAIKARLSGPDGIAVDGSDSVFFADSRNNAIRRIGAGGVIIITVFGAIRSTELNSSSALDGPRGITIDSAGDIYVADRGHHRICKIDRTGTLTVVAGDGVNRGIEGTLAPGDGALARDASIPYPVAVALDPDGNLLIAAAKIRRVDRNGIITTIAGARLDGEITDGTDPLKERLGSPGGIVVDKNGSVYVADTFRHRVLRIDPGVGFSVVAGLSRLPEEKDGGSTEFVRTSNPWGVAVGPSGDLFIADTGMNRIIKITRDGRFSRIAGKGVPIGRIEGSGPPPQFSGDGGPATAADLDDPCGVALDAGGNIFISDSLNNRIRKVTADGRIRTIAGTGEVGFAGDGGPAVFAKLAHPMGLAVDGTGNVYIADRENNRIRAITPEGIIRTVAGSGKMGPSEDGPALSVALNFPHGVAVDSKGTLYIADTFNHRIRKLDRDGVVRVVAGTGRQEFVGDEGPAAKAGLGAPDSLAIDAEGNIYVADRANWRVRKITPDGIIHTIAGNHATGFYGDGGPALNAPIFPTAVAVDAHGVIYATDHNRIRVLTPEGNK